MKINKIGAVLLIIVLLLSGCTKTSKDAIASEPSNEVSETEVTGNEEDKGTEVEDKTDASTDPEGTAEGTEEATEEATDDKPADEEATVEEVEAVEVEEETTDVEKMYISVDVLNVRSLSSTKGDVIGKVAQGYSFEILEVVDNGNNDKWYRIDYDQAGTSVEGWLYAKYTTNEKTTISRPYPDVDYSAYEKLTEFPDNPAVKVKGVYVTGYSTTNSKIDEIIKVIKETELNAVVIDVKDDNGNLLFFSETAEKVMPKVNKKVYWKDNIDELIKKLKDEDIYIIGRVVTFKSPKYAKAFPEKSIVYTGTHNLFSNGDGTAWASPYNRELWDYNVGIAKEAVNLGFDEIQFDYVRFPATGGKVDKKLDFRNELGESKTLAIQGFLKYAREELNPLGAFVSADLFGWAATSSGDVGIGQHWEALSNVVDYTCPMIYPSHYGPNNFGIPVPDAAPYKTIKYSMLDAISRNQNIETPSKLRPWIQDFTAKWVKGYIVYRAPEVKAQIQALEDLGIEEYLVWNASNRYHYDAFDKE